MLAFVGLSAVSRLMAYRDMRRLYYPLALAVLGVAAVGVLYAVDPSLLHSMLDRFNIFLPSGASQTIGEAQTMLSLTGFAKIFLYFTFTIFLALIALGLLVHGEFKKGSAEKTFLIVWSILMLAAMLGQTRFAYYFAVNVAMLAGYLCWRILAWSYLREITPKREKVKRKKSLIQRAAELDPRAEAILTGVPLGTMKATFSRGYLRRRYATPVGVAAMVFIIAILPNIAMTTYVAGNTNTGPNEAWHSSLVWMRENTPDPFEDPDFYYELYDRPPAGEGYDYPESAYGVMNWWDYGHWITRIAHRIPSANPFQAGARDTAYFFIAQDESSANEILDELGSKYVIHDYDMAAVGFPGMVTWAGEDSSQFGGEYDLNPDDGVLELTTLYYPEYYRSMSSRLYNFGGGEVVPHNSTQVISYEEKSNFFGGLYKEVTSIKSFGTYEEALEYLESQTASNYRIVGEDPFISPVPLEELEHYKLVHRSDPEVVGGEEVTISLVKIFEYLP